MSFCKNCGTQVDGKFCEGCGTAVQQQQVPQQPAQQVNTFVPQNNYSQPQGIQQMGFQMPQNPQYPQYPQYNQPKPKKHPAIIVLGILGLLAAVAMVIFLVIPYFMCLIEGNFDCWLCDMLGL